MNTLTGRQQFLLQEAVRALSEEVQRNPAGGVGLLELTVLQEHILRQQEHIRKQQQKQTRPR